MGHMRTKDMDQKKGRVILVRHGESIDNAAGLVQGQGGGPLSDLGREQARAVAARLRGENPAAFYASDLLRAKETVALIALELGGGPVLHDARLREQDFGVYQGRPIRQLLRDMVKTGAGFTSFDPEGGEPAGLFRTRVQEILQELAARHPDVTILLVTHHGFIRMAQRMDRDARRTAPQGCAYGHGAISVAELTPAGIFSLREYRPGVETSGHER